MPAPHPKRSCGECDACCTTLQVDELAKAAHTPCALLKRLQPNGGSGCSIWKDPTRPSICHTFVCEWLAGFGENHADRPDRLGLILRMGHATEGPLASEPFALVHEIINEAHPRPRARTVLAQIGQNIPIVLVKLSGERVLLGSKAIVERLGPQVLGPVGSAVVPLAR